MEAKNATKVGRPIAVLGHRWSALRPETQNHDRLRIGVPFHARTCWNKLSTNGIGHAVYNIEWKGFSGHLLRVCSWWEPCSVFARGQRQNPTTALPDSVPNAPQKHIYVLGLPFLLKLCHCFPASLDSRLYVRRLPQLVWRGAWRQGFACPPQAS